MEPKKYPSWRSMNADTAPWADRLQLEFFRDAPGWRKLEMAAELTQGMLHLAEAGLREQHPDALAEEIRRRLADLVLGPDLALKVYGPLAPVTAKIDHSNDSIMG